MTKIKRISFLAVVLFTLTAVQSFAQQITKFGVVDISKVYSAYYKNSAPLRSYEEKKTAFQNEANKRAEEIKSLKQKRSEYQKSGDTENARKLDEDIKKKTDYLTEYTNAKNVELESLAKSLKNSDDFYKKLYSTLEKLAETGGYSMILSLQESNSILWYSSSVDITNQVITELGL